MQARRFQISPSEKAGGSWGTGPSPASVLPLLPLLGLLMRTGWVGEGGWKTWRRAVESGGGGWVWAVWGGVDRSPSGACCVMFRSVTTFEAHTADAGASQHTNNTVELSGFVHRSPHPEARARASSSSRKMLQMCALVPFSHRVTSVWCAQAKVSLSRPDFARPLPCNILQSWRQCWK